MAGKSIDVGSVKANDIQQKANSLDRNGVLAHGFLTTELCAQVGLAVTEEVEKPPRQPIDREYIPRHCYRE